MSIYFSDIFKISPTVLDEYGAFNISLATDLPLFVDPFLLFHSDNEQYKQLHADIIRYLIFLRDKSANGQVSKALIDSWYRFPEVNENWLGFSTNDNKGRGLGRDFATALNSNLSHLFGDFGNEQITKGSHLEKLCLIKDGVGRDNISDFTTNLIKGFLLAYTQEFAKKHLEKDSIREFSVDRVRFDYDKTQAWERGKFLLPCFNNHYVLLTPKDILTKDSTWINREDLYRNFDEIPDAIPDQQLRAQVNNYFESLLPKDPQKKDQKEAILKVIQKYPTLIDYFIRFKEEHGEDAEKFSMSKVHQSEELFIEAAKKLRQQLQDTSKFYETATNSLEAAKMRVGYLKDVIEKNDGYRIFWFKDKPIKREEDIQILFRLTWCGSPFDVNREVNNGRGPVDYKVSFGALDNSLVEFKLAKNTHLKKNLANQVQIYEAANNTINSLKVILYFSYEELERVRKILKELNLEGSDGIILIDARNDNKQSASVADSASVQ
jgi:hypothetical protein